MELLPGLESALMVAAVAGVRTSSLLLFAPFFNSALMPVRIRLGLALFLTVAMLPMVGAIPHQLDMAGWLHLLVSEVLVGALLGAPLMIISEAVQFAGQILGIQVGLSLVNVLDPQSSIDTPVLSVFQQMLFLLLMFALDVPEWVLRGMAQSFTYLPPGTAQLSGLTVQSLLHGVAAIWLVGVQLSAPVLVTTVLADVSLGLLGKVSPQLPVLWLGISVKSLLGITVLAASLMVWPGFFDAQFRRAILMGEEWLRTAH